MLTINEWWYTGASREFSTSAITAAAWSGTAAAGPNSPAGGGKNAAGYLNAASTGNNNTHLLIITVQTW